MYDLFPIANSFWDNFAIIIPEGPFLRFKTEEMKPTVIILCGIPTSGKSTWADSYQKNEYIRYHGEDIRIPRIISRDKIRLDTFGIKYKQNNKDEQLVTEIFDKMITLCIDNKLNIIIDNAHTVAKYLNASINRFKSTDYTINVKFFDIPLWLAYYRNITRRWRTGKWIPFNVIKRMKKNFKNLNKKDYAKYKL